MKYRDKYVGSQDEIYALLKELPKQFLQNKLVVETEKIDIPADKELEYKVKYENDEYEGSLSIKISWMNAEAEEEEEEEEEDPEEEEEEEE
jgi:amphi-Trp domain-containing protein